MHAKKTCTVAPGYHYSFDILTRHLLGVVTDMITSEVSSQAGRTNCSAYTGRQTQTDKAWVPDSQLVSQPPKHSTKCEADSKCQHNPGAIVLGHAPVGCHVFGKDGPELRHDGLGVLCVKFELFAAFHWRAVV